MTTIPLDNLDECEYYEDNVPPTIDNDYYGMPDVDESDPSQIVITQQLGDTVYTAKIKVRPEWDYDDIEIAKQRALESILKRQTDNFKLHVGYGIGGRFNTPLGAMRLDWGFGSEGNKLHFSMGQSF